MVKTPHVVVDHRNAQFDRVRGYAVYFQLWRGCGTLMFSFPSVVNSEALSLRKCGDKRAH